MEKFLRVDLHIHSAHSFDSSAKIREILEEARKKGLDVIGITDHGTRNGGIEAAKIAGEIKVLVGQEVKTKQGDILVFNVNQDLEERLDVKETCKRAKDMGGFIIIPHPFDPFRKGIGKHLSKVLKWVDCIEVFNPKCFFGWSNRKAEDYAKEHGIPGIASSDAHRKENVGMAHTIVRESNVFEAIKKGEVEMVKSSMGKGRMIGKRLRKGLGKESI